MTRLFLRASRLPRLSDAESIAQRLTDTSEPTVIELELIRQSSVPTFRLVFFAHGGPQLLKGIEQLSLSPLDLIHDP